MKKRRAHRANFWKLIEPYMLKSNMKWVELEREIEVSPSLSSYYRRTGNFMPWHIPLVVDALDISAEDMLAILFKVYP